MSRVIQHTAKQLCRRCHKPNLERWKSHLELCAPTRYNLIQKCHGLVDRNYEGKLHIKSAEEVNSVEV